MVDIDSLQKIPLDQVTQEMGYCCEGCHQFRRVYLTTRSLDDALDKLKKINRKHSKFSFLFAKTLHKAEALQVK